MIRIIAAIVILVSWASPGVGQVFDFVNLDRLNRTLCGRLEDHTWNHGKDRRLFSPILCRKRDLYVYLPPGYDPSVAYPLILLLHGADLDEHAFLDRKDLIWLDQAMARGEMPPAVVACPDDVRRQEPDHRRPFSLRQRRGRAVRGPPRPRGRART